MITWDDFEKVELRIGTIIEVTDFPEARKPAYKLRVDFGSDIGIRKSSAQLTDLYGKEELVGKQVLAVTNFPPQTDRTIFVGVPGHRRADGEGRSYPGKTGRAGG